MSTGHDFQQLQGPKGGVATACRYCLLKPDDPKAKEPCAANVIANMPASNDPKSALSLPLPPHILAAASQPPPKDEDIGPWTEKFSAVKLVQRLNAEEIESKIAEMRGEIAELEVLLAAARARDGLTPPGEFRIPMATRKKELIEFLLVKKEATRFQILAGTSVPEGSLSQLLREPEFEKVQHGMWRIKKT